MNLQEQINQDLKTAMLAGDKNRVSTLRGLKSSLLNEEIAQKKRETGLSDEAVITVLRKASKQRQESADLYKQGGNNERATAELSEKTIIDDYLPDQVDDKDIAKVVDQIISASESPSLRDMGRIIGQVRSELGPGADGGTIAKLVREHLS